MKQVILVTLSISAHYCAKWTAKGTTVQWHNYNNTIWLSNADWLPNVDYLRFGNIMTVHSTTGITPSQAMLPAHLTTKTPDELIQCRLYWPRSLVECNVQCSWFEILWHPLHSMCLLQGHFPRYSQLDPPRSIMIVTLFNITCCDTVDASAVFTFV